MTHLKSDFPTPAEIAERRPSHGTLVVRFRGVCHKAIETLVERPDDHSESVNTAGFPWVVVGAVVRELEARGWEVRRFPEHQQRHLLTFIDIVLPDEYRFGADYSEDFEDEEGDEEEDEEQT